MNKIVGVSFSAVVVIVLFLYFMYPFFSRAELGYNLEEVSVYETAEYQIYKQFSQLISNSHPEQMEYLGEVTVDDVYYYQYKIEDITLSVMSPTNKKIEYEVEYIISYKDNKLTFQNLYPRFPEDVSFYYVDINKDQKKDIVAIGSPHSGTNNTYYWLYAIDLTIMDEIPVIELKEQFITSLQNEQLKNMLDNDKLFQSIFPDMERMDYVTIPYVDFSGNIYYKLGIGKDLTHTLGEIIVLLNYNKETRNFDVVDYIYMPDYIFTIK